MDRSTVITARQSVCLSARISRTSGFVDDVISAPMGDSPAGSSGRWAEYDVCDCLVSTCCVCV